MSSLINLGSSVKAAYQKLREDDDDDDDDDSVLDVSDEQDGGRDRKGRQKRWWEYGPLYILILLMLAPQYSILSMLVSYYLKIYDSPFLFLFHLSVIHVLFFLAACSLMVCVIRDPGAVQLNTDNDLSSNVLSHNQNADQNEAGEDEDNDTDILSALSMSDSRPRKSPVPFNDDPDFNAPHKWCRKCWAPKPERTHHCSACGRCILKMDHHCPWLAQKCVGQWTYTSFLHFLACITFVSMYICILSGRIVYVAFAMPLRVSETTALHSLFLTLYAAIFGLVVGAFWLWHVYLASTNQTTIENISPFLLLRYLPTPPPIVDTDRTEAPPPGAGSFGSGFSPAPTFRASPPLPTNRQASDSQHSDPTGIRKRPIQMTREYQLSSAQRRLVRYAAPDIRLYDVGFRENWAQLLRVPPSSQPIQRLKGILGRVLWGGGGASPHPYRMTSASFRGRENVESGDGWPRNPRARVMLEELAAELAAEERDN